MIKYIFDVSTNIFEAPNIFFKYIFIFQIFFKNIFDQVFFKNIFDQIFGHGIWIATIEMTEVPSQILPTSKMLRRIL